LQVLDDLALVRRLDAREQPRVSYGLGLVVGVEVVELSAGERLAVGGFRLREDADTTTDRLGRRLSPSTQQPFTLAAAIITTSGQSNLT